MSLPKRKIEARRLLTDRRLLEAKGLCESLIRKDGGDAEVWLLLAIANAELGTVREAASCCERALALRAGYLEARITLGRICAVSGERDRAVFEFRRALVLQPDSPVVLHMLVSVLFDAGRFDECLQACQALLRVAPRPDLASIHARRGDALSRLGRREEALQSYVQAASLDPAIGPRFCQHGEFLSAAGRWVDAAAYLAEIAHLVPGCGEVLTDLGRALHYTGRSEEAMDVFRRAIAVAPGLATAHNNLGAMFLKKSDFDQAASCFREALRLNPAFADAHNNLGTVFMRREMWDDALAACSEALRLQPEFAEALANIGNIHAKCSRCSQAVPWMVRALAIQPENGAMNNNLGCTLQKLGDVEGAVFRFREAMRCDPSNTDAPKNLVFTLNCLDHSDPAELYAEHLRWADRCGGGPAVPQAWDNVADPDRRLRVGYVSPDFRSHSVAYFIEPLLAAHDAATTTVFCYADVKKPDEVTARLRELASCWRDTRGLPDEQFAAMVRSDRIDILVDLAGHTDDNRLAVFARRAAPVQVTYLGYPNTTGLASMDYRLTDAWADPPGLTDSFNTETLVRLPRGFLCYRPDQRAPDPAPSPTYANGYVTFGSFNNVMKISRVVTRTWSAILRAVPDARLLLRYHVLHEPMTRDRIMRAFMESGIDPARIQLDGFKAKRDHFEQYARVDIALDPFPYNGTTTTCESLWMGVPVLALAGNAHAGRVGVSLLSQVGLEDWIARDEEEYVAKAVRFVADISSLSAIRDSLRNRLQASPLLDAAGFTHDVEAAYREMWRKWCSSERNREPALPVIL